MQTHLAHHAPHWPTLVILAALLGHELAHEVVECTAAKHARLNWALEGEGHACEAHEARKADPVRLVCGMCGEGEMRYASALFPFVGPLYPLSLTLLSFQCLPPPLFFLPSFPHQRREGREHAPMLGLEMTRTKSSITPESTSSLSSAFLEHKSISASRVCTQHTASVQHRRTRLAAWLSARPPHCVWT